MGNPQPSVSNETDHVREHYGLHLLSRISFWFGLCRSNDAERKEQVDATRRRSGCYRVSKPGNLAEAGCAKEELSRER